MSGEWLYAKPLIEPQSLIPLPRRHSRCDPPADLAQTVKEHAEGFAGAQVLAPNRQQTAQNQSINPIASFLQSVQPIRPL